MRSLFSLNTILNINTSYRGSLSHISVPVNRGNIFNSYHCNNANTSIVVGMNEAINICCRGGLRELEHLWLTLYIDYVLLGIVCFFHSSNSWQYLK